MFSTISCMFQDIQCSPQQFKEFLTEMENNNQQQFNNQSCNIVYNKDFWNKVCQQRLLSFYVEKIYILITMGYNLYDMFLENDRLIDELAILYANQKDNYDYEMCSSSSSPTQESIRLLQLYKFIFRYLMSRQVTSSSSYVQPYIEDEQHIYKRHRLHV